MKQELSTVAIALAKKIFHLVGADTTGKILRRKRLTRNALMPFLAQLPPVLIGIEACGGAHYWARRFREEQGVTIIEDEVLQTLEAFLAQRMQEYYA